MDTEGFPAEGSAKSIALLQKKGWIYRVIVGGGKSQLLEGKIDLKGQIGRLGHRGLMGILGVFLLPRAKSGKKVHAHLRRKKT